MLTIARRSLLLLLGGAGLVACGPSTSAPDTADAYAWGRNPDGGFYDVDGPPIVLTGGDGGACAATKSLAQGKPLDIYVMMDQSSSMSDTVGTSGTTTKWDACSAALKSFVNGSNTNGISIGIQYFGVPVGGGTTCNSTGFCNTDADCGDPSCGPCDTSFGTPGFCLGSGSSSTDDSCTAADYANPDVEIAPLPGVASSIVSSINAHGPTTLTPTAPALQGAIDHASSWAKSNPNDAVVVILATDGDPSECDPTDLPSINNIAAAGYNGTPSIPTFVIGVGPDTANLNGIAVAGGTQAAFLVDTGGNVQQQFTDALNQIRGSVLGCQYKIPVPSSGTPDYGQVNVEYTPGGGSAQVMPQVQDQASCPSSGNAWYYDNPGSPTQILLCPSTCSTVEADASAEVDILLGCATVIGKPSR